MYVLQNIPWLLPVCIILILPCMFSSSKAVAGLMPDARQLIGRAREESANYRKTYGEVIPPQALNEVCQRNLFKEQNRPFDTCITTLSVQRLGSFVHLYTQYWYLRPFGASILFAGYDVETKKHELYCIEPNGTALRYFGYAIGTSLPTWCAYTRV